MMKRCQTCGHEEPDEARFCTRCGAWLAAGGAAGCGRQREEMNLTVLYGMVVLLLLALIVPPWETPAGQPPEFLGFHFILRPPVAPSGGEGVVSRLLLTIELVTIATGGVYVSWLLRRKE